MKRTATRASSRRRRIESDDPPLSERDRPSIEEFKGWYNLGYDPHDGHPVLHSVPCWDAAEFHNLWLHGTDWFDHLVQVPSGKPFDPLCEPPFFLCEFAGDRTVTVDANCDFVTPTIIERIRREFLSRYPLWRVLVVMEKPAFAIVIYPDAVRYGNFPLGTDPRQALRDLIPRVAAAREERTRPARTRLSFLRRRLRRAVREIGRRRSLVVGQLRCRAYGDEVLAIFVLYRGAETPWFRLDGPRKSGRDLVASGETYGVDKKGSICSSVSVPKSAPFCVREFFVKPDFRGRLRITEGENGPYSVHEVRSEDIVHADSADRPLQRHD